jgi:hypothetical protein
LIKPIRWLAVLAAAIWALSDPGFEPVVTLIATLAGATTIQTRIFGKGKGGKPLATLKETTITIEPSKRERADEESPTVELVDRFLDIFINHGIHINEIPRCVPKKFRLSLSDLSRKEKLAEKLTPEMIDWICSTFNIQRKWLETNTGNIYKTENYYKNEYSFLRLLKNLKMEHQNNLRVIAYKDVKNLNAEEDHPQNVNLLIVIPAFKLDDKFIMKYIPTWTHWDWGYWRSRYQLKSIIRLCQKKLKLTFDGHNLSTQKMTELSSGKVFPKNILDNVPIGYTWYPDDYTDKSSESQCTKETLETSSILEYINEKRYMEIFEEETPQPF